MRILRKAAKSAALFCAAAFGLSAWAATPLAVWNGDFDTATTRNGVTFSANGNTINADGTVTIASGSTTGISFDLPATYDYVTAVFTVTGVTGKTAANAVLVSTKSGNSAYGGVYVKSGSLGTGGINGTTAWSITSADGTITSYDDTNTTDVNEDATAERTFAVTQVNSDRVQNGMHLFEIVGGGTDATVVFGSNGNNGLRYALGYNVITIGGFQTTPSETGAIGTMEGLTLKSVAIYASNKSWPLDGTGRANFAMPRAFNISDDTSLSTINATAADYTDNVFVNFTADGLFLTADAGAASNVILPYDTTATVADGTLTLAGDLPVKLGSSITAVEGSGTVVAVGATDIDALPSGAFSSDAWTGTVWLKGRTGWTNIVPTNYGNAGSTLRFSGISGYFAKAQYNASATPAFELENDSYDYGYTITDGYSFNSNGSYSYFQTKTLKGSGSLISNAKGGGLISVTENWGEFTGSINLSNRTIWLGFTDAPNSSSSTDTTFGVIGGTIRLNNVDVTPGAAWTFASGGGFVGAGTVHLAYPWYGTANCGTNSRWEGTIELAAYTATQNVAINLAYMGNANSTIVLKGLSSTAASNSGPYIEPANGSTVTATVQLDGDVTFGAANSGKTQTLNKITGTGNLNFFYTGSHTYNILDVSGYTGTIAAKANSTVYVGVSTAPAVGDRIAKLDSSNHNVSTTVNVNNSDIGVRGELTTVDEVYGLYATTAATVGEDAYASLDAAIAAAGEGGTVTLSRDITLATLAVADDVTINVGSHTLTATTLTVDEDATVTIAGTGTLTASSATVSGELAFANAGTFSLTGSAASSIAALTADAALTFLAEGEVTVGEITANADMTFAAKLVNTTALTKKGTGTLNFYGVTAPTAGIVIEGGEVAINNTLDGISPAVWLDASDATTITETDGKVTAWASTVNNYNFTNETSAMTYEDAEGVFGGQKVVRTNNSQLEADFSDAHETYSVFAAAHYYSNSGTGGILCYRSGANNCYFGKRNTKDKFWSSLRTSSTPVSLWQNGSTSSVNFTTADKILSNASWYNNSADVNHIGGTSGDIAIAEFIGLSSDPSMANRKRIEAYLGNKWSVDGMVSLATAVPVTLSNGAVLDLGGLERTVASISGSGTVANGTLTVTDPISLSAGDVLTLPITAEFTPDTVAAKIVDSDAGTITLYGSVQDAIDNYTAGTLTILASGTVSIAKELEITGVVVENGAELTFTQVAPFAATFKDGTIACTREASTYAYVGTSPFNPVLANFKIGGVASTVLPEEDDTIEFDTAVTVDVTSTTYAYAALVLNANLTVVGEGNTNYRLRANSISGSGTLVLEGGAVVSTTSGNNTISCPVEVDSTTENPVTFYIRASSQSVILTGTLSGSGNIACVCGANVNYAGVKFRCSDASGFEGEIEAPANNSDRNFTAFSPIDLSGAKVTVNAPGTEAGKFIEDSSTSAVYKFGSLKGSVFVAASNMSDGPCRVEIGALNCDDTITSATWMLNKAERSPNIVKVGTGTLTFEEVTGVNAFILNGGSLVVPNTVTLVPTTEVTGNVGIVKTEDTQAGTYTYTLVQYVASVTHGETVTPCTTLAAAIAAAQSGDTVTLLADVTLDARVEPNLGAETTLTIDLGGYTLTREGTSGNGSVFDVKSGTVTIKNGTIDCTQDDTDIVKDGVYAITARSGSAVTLENLTITVDSQAGACVYPFDGATVTIKSGTYTNETAEEYQYHTGWTGMAVNQANVTTQLLFIEGGKFWQVNPEEGDDSGNVANFLAAGRIATLVDGYWTVSEGAWVAQVGSTKYTSLADAIAAAESGDTATLLANVTLDASLAIPAGKTLTLNLNGYTLTGPTGKNYAIANSGNITLTGGTITGYGVARNVADGATITVTDGTYTATGANGFINVTDAVGCAVTINGGTFTAQEAVVATGRSKNSSITVNSGTLTSIDNAVLMDNGSSGYTGNTITVTGGIFNGGITTAGYVACGIYCANDTTVNVTGGTFNITGGCGILARAGKVSVSGTTVINTTGTATGKVGDSRIVVPCAPIVYDSAANYPGYDETTTTFAVSGGTFTANGQDVACIVHVADEGDAMPIAVTGGTFSSDVSAFCADGYAATETSTGVWTVAAVQEVSVEPGAQTEPVDSKADAEAAAEKTVVSVPTAVAEALTAEQQTVYKTLFEAKVVEVTVDNETKYAVEVALTADAETALQTAVDAEAKDLADAAVAAAANATTGGTATVATTPGLYYVVEAGADIGSIEPASCTLANSTETTLTIPNKGTSGFYKIRVSVTPVTVTTTEP